MSTPLYIVLDLCFNSSNPSLNRDFDARSDFSQGDSDLIDSIRAALREVTELLEKIEGMGDFPGSFEVVYSLRVTECTDTDLPVEEWRSESRSQSWGYIETPDITDEVLQPHTVLLDIKVRNKRSTSRRLHRVPWAIWT